MEWGIASPFTLNVLHAIILYSFCKFTLFPPGTNPSQEDLCNFLYLHFTYFLFTFFSIFFCFISLSWFDFPFTIFVSFLTYPHIVAFEVSFMQILCSAILKKLFNLQLQTHTLWCYKDQHKFSQQSSRSAHILFFALSSIGFFCSVLALVWFFRLGGILSSLCKHIFRQAVHLIVFHVKSHELSLHKLGAQPSPASERKLASWLALSSGTFTWPEG